MPLALSITSKRQVTFPAHVLAQLGAKTGDKIALLPSPQGFLLRTLKIKPEKHGTLRSRIKPEIAAAKADFDIAQFRAQPYEPSLRD